MAKNKAHSGTSDLMPGSDLKLLFKGYLSHGPGGGDEQVEYWVGSDSTGGFDVLWLSSDWEDNVLNAVESTPSGHDSPVKVGMDFLRKMWFAEKIEYEADGPAHDWIDEDMRSILSEDDVTSVVRSVWSSEEESY